MAWLDAKLYRTVFRLAMRKATEAIDSGALRPYNACRPIPLDKNPAVRPFGFGEVRMRIICSFGQKCERERAIHS